jgi:hypothetical protein
MYFLLTVTWFLIKMINVALFLVRHYYFGAFIIKHQAQYWSVCSLRVAACTAADKHGTGTERVLPAFHTDGNRGINNKFRTISVLLAVNSYSSPPAMDEQRALLDRCTSLSLCIMLF